MRVFLALIVAAVMLSASAAYASTTDPLTPDDGNRIWRGSETNGPNGVYVGPDGNVYAASVGGDEITVHNPRNGKVIDRIGPERGVQGPDDLYITRDGTIYSTDLLDGYVRILRPDGSFDKQFVAPGVNPITMNEDETRLFVALDFLGNGLYELDPELIDPPKILIPDLFGLNGMDFGPDGLLYGPLFFGGSIVRIDVDAPELGFEVVASGFVTPAAVAFNSLGELYAVDLGTGQLIKVDVATGDWVVLDEVEDNLDNLAFDDNDQLFVTSATSGQVLKMRPNGTLRALNRSGFTAPSGLAVTDDGTLWVAEGFALRGIWSRWNPIASFFYRFDAPFAGPGGMNTVAADGNNVITTGLFSNSVQVLDPATGTILEDLRTLSVPVNAVRHGDVLAVAQLGAGNVIDGQTGDVILEGLFYPLGLATDGETLYVGDWAAGTVTAVTDSGSSVVASGLAGPEGLALDGDRLLVVEVGLDQLSAVDLTTGAVSTLVTGLDLGPPVLNQLAPPHGNFNGVAVNAKGSVYVSQDGAINAVYKFRRL